jgi:hypothetical protein
MRTLVIRVTALVFLAVLVPAVAVVTLGSQPKVIPTYSGPVPDVACPFGVSPAQSFCYATAPPGSSKAPDTDVPPASTQASTAP